MKARISPSAFMKSAPKKIGEQIHINHVGCSAGEDTKKRLYVKRVTGGVLAYCHHCGCAGASFEKKGSYETESLRKYLYKEEPLVGVTSRLSDGDLVKLLEESNLNQVSIDSAIWLNKYPIVTTHFSPTHFSATTDGDIVLPIRNSGDNTIGAQIRRVDKLPKYLTYYSERAKGNSAWFTPQKPMEFGAFFPYLAITEDMLSAGTISTYRNIPSVALIGTSMDKYTEEDLLSFVNSHRITKIVIWLDDDAAGQKAAGKLFVRLSYILPAGVHVVNVQYKQPKECTMEEINHHIT